MKFRAQLLLLSASTCLVLSAPQCNAQSILNQSSDDLLKDFDVDPNQVAAQYKPRPVSKTERFLQMFGGAMSKSNAGSKSSTNNGTSFGTNPGTNTGPNTAYNTGTFGTTRGSKSGDGGTLRVRAPFLKLDMINGERCIRVDAPFLTYDSNPAMSENIRNQESSAAAMPSPAAARPPAPAPVSRALPADTGSVALPSSGFRTDALAPQNTGSSALDIPSSSAKPGRMRLERSKALPQ